MAEELKKTFNEVAELYDRARNDYPDELFEELFRLSGCHSGSDVLEIAAGTGKATLHLAQRGCRVTAVELGQELALVARHKLAKFRNVEIQVGAFEEWEAPSEATYDLVVVATAFHWLDPEVRFKKIASLLRPGGHLAIIRYHHVAGGDQAFFEQVQLCYEQFKTNKANKFTLPRIEELQPETYGAESNEWFDPPVRRTYVKEEVYNRQQYLDLLSTYSDHRMMGEKERQGLFHCIGRLMDEGFDGQIRKCYLYELLLMRRR
ncbi:class I SAM-dependent methyltransferase [Paenibacillus vulneris]|uniref:Class I SAM-dependent methyltransferase n=1 Tax=Paenibacillus vulneris TaxID=1133364 RepID=A0ABW3UQF3_9BACL